MPTFIVRKGQDAWVYYETIVKADTPETARGIADSDDFDGEWLATGEVAEYDDYEIHLQDVRPFEEGETIEEHVTIAVTAPERDALITGLRVLQLALQTNGIGPNLQDILTNGGAHAGIDVAAIDTLTEHINR